MEKKNGRKLIPGDPSLSQEELDAIKAVREYENAVKVLDLFKIENSAVFKMFSELADEVEQKRQVADQTIRGTKASFGPWELFSEQRKYKPQELYNLVGEQMFLALGGRLVQTQTYEIDKEKVELAISSKQIPEEIVPSIREITPKYRSPKD